MTSEYAPLTPAVLRQAVEFVLRGGGGMCVAVCKVLWRLGHSNEGKSFRLLYEASEGKLWRVSGYGYLRRFGLPRASGEWPTGWRRREGGEMSWRMTTEVRERSVGCGW